MVSIHRVSVIAYLIIRVIYFTFRFKRGTVCHILYLKVVGNHRCRCNNSSPRYMRENHYAILASN